MARFFRDPMFLNFHELLNKGEKRIPVERLSVNGLAKARVVFKDMSYRESNPGGARVHTLHIHVGSEERYFAIFITVRLHTLEK